MRKSDLYRMGSIRYQGIFVVTIAIIIFASISGARVTAFDSFKLSASGLGEMTWAKTNGTLGTRPTAQIHGEITRGALTGLNVKAEVVELVIQGNWRADWDETEVDFTSFAVVPSSKYDPAHHFDRNQGETDKASFVRGANYLKAQRAIVISGLKGINGKNLNDAAQAIGRALHAMQDFFSHSNVIDLKPVEWDAVMTALKNASDPPGVLKITSYDKVKGGDVAGDNFGHDKFCKDNPSKNSEATSKMVPGSKDFDINLTKFDRAKKAATEFSKDWLTEIKKEIPANQWPS